MIISAGSLIFVVIAIFYDYGIGVRLVTHTSGAFSFLTLICSVVSCSKRYVPAYFFFVAWLVFIVGSLLQIFVSGGIIAPTFYAKYGNLIGSGVQIIILSLALGYKLKIIEVKRRQAEFNSHLIRKDLDAAKVVQDSFLIPELPEIEGYRVKAYYHPSLAVGGDWYSIYDDHENSRLYVMIGDVTGHGIASALVTGSTAGSIMTVFKIFPGDSSPEDMLRHLADTANLNVLDIGRKSERWMTMTFICIDYCFHKAYYLNAGHNASYFKLEDRVKTVIQGSRPLGLSSEPYTKVQQIDMASGSSFFLYTDGLLENSSVEGVHLDDKKLIEQIKSNSMPELFDELVRTAQNFESSYQTDDTAFILIERKASKAKLKAV
ncbi:PP2C family protein-serine/threonine phosphatase [Pseudobacteriovorax antillogorgiicola]|uniref:Serine phosphatase RsbU, regulator of sigma subunit n=1 Tax=Pseudobacteriovorax antillogorgiicola TaxID=1513793 RepID=A0A1Y6BMD0_9BACT|nr:SpoIIE family protein phosphatase [Pseudobacteriovorax antillogorgiicola]TCS54525.1 serine phosphatase RsbU (regulator of sigma subunit) [Pseudobacteriovorax antillogorgiicola]SMF18790.1 Serine phosphatase RsbU, regulator of sigma subunit [Pseudobacteriovorax antillogorgiicola]